VKRAGLFIPIDIWNLGELHPNERVLLAEVLNFESQGKECFASNAHFADLLNVSEATARGYISKLVNAGFLIREGDRYNRRLRKSAQTSAQIRADECVNPRKRTRKSTQTSAQNSAHNKTYNKTENKTLNKSAQVRDVILPFQTDTFTAAWDEWKEYKRTDHRFKYKTAQSEQRALIKLQNEHPEESDAIEAIHTAIANGWKGLVFGQSKNGRTNARRAQNLESDVNREKLAEFARTGRIRTDGRNVL
jgi:DNA-binding MarR family transcriptional regulator